MSPYFFASPNESKKHEIDLKFFDKMDLQSKKMSYFVRFAIQRNSFSIRFSYFFVGAKLSVFKNKIAL